MGKIHEKVKYLWVNWSSNVRRCRTYYWLLCRGAMHDGRWVPRSQWNLLLTVLAQCPKDGVCIFTWKHKINFCILERPVGLSQCTEISVSITQIGGLLRYALQQLPCKISVERRRFLYS